MLAHRHATAPRSPSGGAHSAYPGASHAPDGTQSVGEGLIAPGCHATRISRPMAVSFKTPAQPGDEMGCMKKTPDFDAAAAFMAGHARVLDRRMFHRLFCDGAAGAVRDAVAAYRNSD